jgi:hypothetical protein
MKITPFVKELDDNQIFVFGSNLEGRHGKGAALTAYQKFGAKYGIGRGLTGKCYAFPTVKKLYPYTTLSLSEIEKESELLFECCKENPDLEFLITEVGCGLAGYEIKDIAPFFKKFLDLDNIYLPKKFYDEYKK